MSGVKATKSRRVVVRRRVEHGPPKKKVVVRKKYNPTKKRIVVKRKSVAADNSMSSLMAEKRESNYLKRFPENDEELWWWVWATWGVRIPRTRVCPNHVAPFEAFADAYFARAPICVWKASRGFGGKTQLLSILGMTELVSLGAFVTILGGSGAQSLRVHETMTEAWNYEGAPKEMLLKDPTKFDTYLKNRGKARTLMASTKSVRGPHPTRMRLDEIDEMELKILEHAQGQPMRKRNSYGTLLETNSVFSSTHQYPDGTMTKILKRAQEEQWPVYQWCYKESSNDIDGWLEADEIERKRTEIPRYMWEAEYDLQEPSFEGRAIDESAVNRMFNADLGYAAADVGKYIEIHEPNHARDYITGVDWAKAQDFTVIWTYDVTDPDNWVLAAFERIQRRPWPQMVNRLNQRWAHYGGKVIHDETGIGGVINDYIEYPRGTRPGDLIGVTMAGRLRSDIITEYISAVERDQFKCPRLQWPFEEHKYATPDDLYNGSSTAHLPDSIAAGALAWHGRNRWKRIAVPSISITRDKSPWRMGNV